MNTLVSLPLAKLLKEKGYSWECENFYKKGKYDKKFYLTTGVEYDSDRNCIWDWNLNGGKSGMLSKVIPYPNESTAIYYSAPTIADVVMWFYDKHRIWIMVEMTGSKKFYPRGRMIDKKGKHHVGDFKYNNERLIYNSPAEAYEAAIEYTLNHLI